MNAQVKELPVAEIITNISELYVDRIATIKAQRSLNSQANAFVARHLGFTTTGNDSMTEAENKKAREKMWGKAAAIARSIEKGNPAPKGLKEVRDQVQGFVTTILASRRALDENRKNIELALGKLAKQLPVWEWMEKTKGIGIGGLWVIIGEAGDLSNYANPAKLWKRMGLAVSASDSKLSQGRVPSTLKGDARSSAYIDEGYSPRRRSAMWTLGDSFIKCKDSKYRGLYTWRKEYELGREDENKPKSQMHAHRRAQRYAEKRMLLDLWEEWNELHGTTPESTPYLVE